MLLHMHNAQGSPLTTGITWSKIAIVPRLRNPAIHLELHLYDLKSGALRAMIIAQGCPPVTKVNHELTFQ